MRIKVSNYLLFHTCLRSTFRFIQVPPPPLTPKPLLALYKSLCLGICGSAQQVHHWHTLKEYNLPIYCSFPPMNQWYRTTYRTTTRVDYLPRGIELCTTPILGRRRRRSKAIHHKDSHTTNRHRLLYEYCRVVISSISSSLLKCDDYENIDLCLLYLLVVIENYFY